MRCVVTQVNKHDAKGHGVAGPNADPLVSENWHWVLGHSHHSPLEVLKKTRRIREEKWGGGWRCSRRKVRLWTLLFIPKDHGGPCCGRLVTRNREI